MTLAPVHVLAFVIASDTRELGGFDTLAVQAASSWVLVARCATTHGNAQGVMDALPGSIVAPRAEVEIDALPFGIVFGQHAPLCSSDNDEQDGIDDLDASPGCVVVSPA